jgi:hypothetical protein
VMHFANDRRGLDEASPPADGLVRCVHAALINASPFLPFQTLFVPYISRCYPQVLTLELLRFGCGLSRTSSRRDFFLGFNSLSVWSPCAPPCPVNVLSRCGALCVCSWPQVPTLPSTTSITTGTTSMIFTEGTSPHWSLLGGRQ